MGRSRDDPNVDENTRLRNRIAELESLVRELRGASPPPAFPSTHCAPALLPARSLSAPAGKPHPKWAEPNFCDGDATEKWHSRSSRRLQFPKGRDGGGRPEDGGRLPPAIKTEQGADPSGQHSLYRFTPSPPHTGVDASGQQYALYGRQTGGAAGGVYSPTDDAAACYTGGGEHYYQDQHHHHHHQQGGFVQQTCVCLTNPAAGNALIALTQQLQNALALLRQLPEHSTARQQAACVITRRASELHDIMQ